LAAFRKRLRRLGRKVTFGTLWLIAASAMCFGPKAVRRVGSAVGRLNRRLTRLACPRLVDDVAVVLDRDRADAERLLTDACRVNDRAVLEVFALSLPWTKVDKMIDGCEVENVEDLRLLSDAGRGAVLLGMHMGNGILMAAALARAGLPVSVAYRESRKMATGFLGRVLGRLGLEPIHLEQANPAAGSRRMFKALREGKLVYVLMDQGSKNHGHEVMFLGKQLYMPDGVIRLVRRSVVPLIPVLPEAAEPVWLFRVRKPVMLAEDDAEALRQLVVLMEDQIRAYPELWSWHHRRWRHQALALESPVCERV